jgi:hypothetical protein
MVATPQWHLRGAIFPWRETASKDGKSKDGPFPIPVPQALKLSPAIEPPTRKCWSEITEVSVGSM